MNFGVHNVTGKVLMLVFRCNISCKSNLLVTLYSWKFSGHQRECMLDFLYRALVDGYDYSWWGTFRSYLWSCDQAVTGQ
jgi:hypothetical protein